MPSNSPSVPSASNAATVWPPSPMPVATPRRPCSPSRAEPVYIDINESLTLCPASLQHQLKHSGPVAAIVATHLYGQLADIDSIRSHCPRIRLPGA
jgi:dTDP-4-amino-4,6-dideoxygalactose transaminase